MDSRRPVVISGYPRSGTTLTQNIISSHPDIEVLRRDQPWWKYFYGARRYQGLGRDPAALRLLLDDVFGSPTLQDLKIPIDRREVEAELAELDLVTFGDVFRVILEQNARNFNKPRWGLKSPGNEVVADAIFAAYPNVLMVQLIRDPRDVLVSLQARPRWWRPAVTHMIHWNRSLHYAERNLAVYRDAYHIVRYEDLVQRPEETIRRLFAFLELDYMPELLEAGSFGQNSSFSDVSSQGINHSPVARHVTRLSGVDVAICNTLGGRVMRRHGYALNSVPIRLSAHIRGWWRILVDWPILHLRLAVRTVAVKAGLRDEATVWLNHAHGAGP